MSFPAGVVGVFLACFIGRGVGSLPIEECSKDVDVSAYLTCKAEDEFLAIQEDLLLRIEDIVSEAGTAFALPSQTAFLARDTGLDSERGEQAERDLQRGRATGRLSSTS
jgi:MscS family membrane protein